jgi:hypothetical protein
MYVDRIGISIPGPVREEKTGLPSRNRDWSFCIRLVLRGDADVIGLAKKAGEADRVAPRLVKGMTGPAALQS